VKFVGRPAVVAVALAIAISVAACGSSDKNAEPTITGAAAKRGMAVATDQGCISCHSATGNRSTGPTWKDLAGSTVTLDGGKTVKADDAYLRAAITDPRSQVVEHYANIMPTTYSSLSADEVDDLIAYLRELSTHTR